RRGREQRAVALLGDVQLAVAAVGADQPDRQRNVEWRLDRLARGRRAVLLELEYETARRGVVATGGAHARRAGLRVPPAELPERDAVGVGDRGDEVVAGDRLPVVPAEVQVHAAPEAVAADQRLEHADHFGALL